MASAPRHRDDHLRARRHGRARRQPRQPRRARRGRHPVDDRGQRHHPSGNAEGRRATGRMHGFQLWANLPASLKMTDAALPGRRRRETSRRSPTTTGRTCGSCAASSGADAARSTASPPIRTYLDVSVPPNRRRNAAGRGDAARLRLRVRRVGHVPRRVGAAAVLTDNIGWRARTTTPPATTPAIARSSCSTAATKSPCRRGEQGIRFLLVSGKPLEEPVAWYGPIVMNTEAELRQAFAEFRNGTFIKTRG